MKLNMELIFMKGRMTVVKGVENPNLSENREDSLLGRSLEYLTHSVFTRNILLLILLPWALQEVKENKGDPSQSPCMGGG